MRKFRTDYSTYIVQDDHRLGPASIGITDGIENAIADEGRDKLFNEENQECRADGSEVEIVDQEQAL